MLIMFLIIVFFILLFVGVMFLMGALLIINPEWLDLRWAWDLNGFDARIIAAWFMGWAVWAGTIAFAHDWDEVRLAGALAVLSRRVGPTFEDLGVLGGDRDAQAPRQLAFRSRIPH